MSEPAIINWRDESQQELAYLAMNKHLTTEDIENSISAWDSKYEYTDAYNMSMQYQEKSNQLKRLLLLRKKWGIL